MLTAQFFFASLESLKHFLESQSSFSLWDMPVNFPVLWTLTTLYTCTAYHYIQQQELKGAHSLCWDSLKNCLTKLLCLDRNLSLDFLFRQLILDYPKRWLLLTYPPLLVLECPTPPLPALRMFCLPKVNSHFSMSICSQKDLHTFSGC